MRSRAAHQMSVNKKLGDAGQEQAANALARLGVHMVEEIGTPFVITKKFSNGLIRGYWKKKVSGDLIGHTRDGIKVLAEVKTIWDQNLRWSDFKKHQPERLSLNAERAISLVIWVHHTGIYIMNWIDVLESGFGRGKSMDIRTAQVLDSEPVLSRRE